MQTDELGREVPAGRASSGVLRVFPLGRRVSRILRGARILRRSTLICCLVLATAGVADAKDFCIAVAGGFRTYIGKAFSVPGKGKCKAFNAVVQPPFQGMNFAGGLACTASDRSHVTFSLTFATRPADADVVDLPLPAMTGGTSTIFGSADFVPCHPSIVPIP